MLSEDEIRADLATFRAALGATTTTGGDEMSEQHSYCQVCDLRAEVERVTQERDDAQTWCGNYRLEVGLLNADNEQLRAVVDAVRALAEAWPDDHGRSDYARARGQCKAAVLAALGAAAGAPKPPTDAATKKRAKCPRCGDGDGLYMDDVCKPCGVVLDAQFAGQPLTAPPAEPISAELPEAAAGPVGVAPQTDPPARPKNVAPGGPIRHTGPTYVAEEPNTERGRE